MKLINQSAEIWQQPEGEIGIYKQVEKAARLCYKSEDKVTKDSYKRFIDMLNSNGHCYTGDSEVLTKDGWVKWKDYKGQQVAVINPDLTFKGFETPKNVIHYNYNGIFYEFPNIGLKVTEGHTMYGMFANKYEDRYREFMPEKFICSTPYKDANGKTKTLGDRFFRVACCTKTLQETKPYYELIGFWLGDGCTSRTSKNHLLFHLKKERKIQYLKQLCLSLNYEFKILANNKYTVNRENLGEEFKQFYENSEKVIRGIYSPIEIHSIIQGLLNSDGHSPSYKNTKYFCNTSKSIIDFIHTWGSIAGYNISKDRIHYWKEIPSYHCRIKTRHTININDSRAKDSKVIKSKEHLEVYCVTVSTGLLMVRGINGVTTICGNCSPLEHGTVYLAFRRPRSTRSYAETEKYILNPYSRVSKDIYDKKFYWEGERQYSTAYVTTNYRVIKENGWEEDLKYLCEPTEYHTKRISVHITTSRSISHELVRHRVFSFCQESQRYCAYNKGKFGNQVTFIKPCWLSMKDTDEGREVTRDWNFDILDGCAIIAEEGEFDDARDAFLTSLNVAEHCYFELLAKGWKPQQAREVLPNATKTELIMTGYENDWEEFFKLRCSPAAHPMMQELANQIKELIHK